MALLPAPPTDHQMDNLEDLGDSGSSLGSEDSGASQEQDDDMLLSHFQKDIKLEAFARRAPTKNKTRLKKGKSSPNP